MPKATTKKISRATSAFERKGKAYVGYAIAFKTPTGAETIILAPTALEAEIAAGNFIDSVDQKLIYKAALIGGEMLKLLEPK